MNTPAHVVLNLLCLNRGPRSDVAWPVVAGALVPDAPMFLFYAVEKFVLGSPESLIWQERYFHPGWQNLIDLFNSIPLVLLGLGWAWQRSPQVQAFCLSMLLHIAGGLPLHHDDAHRHFFPFSNWRFISPVSYWDSDHYGQVVSILELVMVVVGCGWLFRRYPSRWAKASVAVIGLSYTVYLIYALVVWS